VGVGRLRCMVQVEGYRNRNRGVGRGRILWSGVIDMVHSMKPVQRLGMGLSVECD
jgi:hypothetical protein